MEGLTRLVSESLARHGFDRPLDYRRLRWSRWFRCESHHSLLFVPSKPGVFALAEEIMDFGTTNAHAATAAKPALSGVGGAVPRSEASRSVEERRLSAASGNPYIAALAAAGPSPEAESRKPEAASPRRMLAVTQFFEDDDMAFVLDRMLSRQNPMSARLASGRYFARFVVIEDQAQRRSICAALNQWMVSAAEKATGIGSHFATSLELTPATEYIPQPDDRQQSLFAVATDTPVAADAEACPERSRRGRQPEQSSAKPVWDRVSDPVRPSAARQDFVDATVTHVAMAAKPALSEVEGAVPRTLSEAQGSGLGTNPGFSAPAPSPTAPQLDSGAATNIHCPSPFPSGF